MSRYIGGRSEDVGSRSRLGWDMAFGGGGLLVSGGFFATFDDALSRCYDAAPWSAVSWKKKLEKKKHMCVCVVSIRSGKNK